jgi:hypothetical protein
VLARRRRQNAADRIPPQTKRRHGASLREHIAPLFAERGRHVVAEITAKLGGEQAEQSFEDAIGSGHIARLKPSRSSAIARLKPSRSIDCSQRSARMEREAF